jgi:hypothetical protein
MAVERINKFIARLITNDFCRNSEYDELLTVAKIKPIFRIVAERQLINIKKYMDGVRIIQTEVFQLAPPTNHQFSQRIAEKDDQHSLVLKVVKSVKNRREENLAAAQMRRLWNALNEDDVRLPLKQFLSLVTSNEFFVGLIQKVSSIPISI